MSNFITREEGLEFSRQAKVIAHVQGCDRFDALDILARNMGFLDYGKLIRFLEHQPLSHKHSARIPSQDDLEEIYDWFVANHSTGDDVYISGEGVYLRSIFEDSDEILEYVATWSGWGPEFLRPVAERIFEQGPWQREHGHPGK